MLPQNMQQALRAEGVNVIHLSASRVRTHATAFVNARMNFDDAKEQ